MLAHALAFVVALGSFTLYMSAFFLPEVYRKRDFIWSGVGMFYALVLWVYAGRITGGVLLGQVASVTLLGWLGWQTLQMRRSLTPYEQQTWLPSNARTAGDVVRQVSQKLPASLRNLFLSSEPVPSPQPEIPTATVERQPKPRTRPPRRQASRPTESPAVAEKTVSGTIAAQDVPTSRGSEVVVPEVVVPEVVEAAPPVTPISEVQPPVVAESTVEKLDAVIPDQPPAQVSSVETPAAEDDFGFTEEKSSATATPSVPGTTQEDSGGFFSNLRKGFKPKKAPRPPIEVVAQRPERFGEPKVPRSGRTPIQVVARRPERFGGSKAAPQEDTPEAAASEVSEMLAPSEPILPAETVAPAEPPTVQPVTEVDEWEMDWDEPAVTVTETVVEAVSVTDAGTVEVIEAEVVEVFVEEATALVNVIEPIESGSTEDASDEPAIAVEPIELVAIDVETIFAEGESEEPLGIQEAGLDENPFDAALEESEAVAPAPSDVAVEASAIEESSAIAESHEPNEMSPEESPTTEVTPAESEVDWEGEAIAEVNGAEADVHTVEESVAADDFASFEPTAEPSMETAPFLEESFTPFSFELPDTPPPPPVEPLTLEFSDVPPAPVEAISPSHDIVSELEDLFDAPLNTVFSESNASQDAGKKESI